MMPMRRGRDGDTHREEMIPSVRQGGDVDDVERQNDLMLRAVRHEIEGTGNGVISTASKGRATREGLRKRNECLGEVHLVICARVEGGLLWQDS